MDEDEVEITLTRGEVIQLRVILEVHLMTSGETATVRRLHDMFANISAHTVTRY